MLAGCLPKITINRLEFLVAGLCSMNDDSDVFQMDIPETAKLAWDKPDIAFFADNPCEVADEGARISAGDVCLLFGGLWAEHEDLANRVF